MKNSYMEFVRIKDKSVIFKNSSVEFEETIAETMFISNKFIVIRLKSIGYKDDRNVHCLSIEGKLLWKIGARAYPNGPSSVSGIYIENDKLFAYRFCGFEEEIDLTTGKILSSELIK